jgi:AcrR family transcriptional regulator
MSNLKVKTEIRQRQIREAAMEIIADKSLNSLTVAGIAEKVGITKSNIYRHYSSKNAIVEDIVKMIDTNLQKIVSNSKVIDSPAERLKQIFINHIALLEKTKGTPLIIFTSKSYGDNSSVKIMMKVVIKKYTESIRLILCQGVGDKTFNTDLDIKTTLMVYLGLIQSIILQCITSGGAFLPTSKAEGFWAIFIKGISK